MAYRNLVLHYGPWVHTYPTTLSLTFVGEGFESALDLVVNIKEELRLYLDGQSSTGCCAKNEHPFCPTCGRPNLLVEPAPTSSALILLLTKDLVELGNLRILRDLELSSWSLERHFEGEPVVSLMNAASFFDDLAEPELEIQFRDPNEIELTPGESERAEAAIRQAEQDLLVSSPLNRAIQEILCPSLKKQHLLAKVWSGLKAEFGSGLPLPSLRDLDGKLVLTWEYRSRLDPGVEETLELGIDQEDSISWCYRDVFDCEECEGCFIEELQFGTLVKHLKHLVKIGLK